MEFRMPAAAKTVPMIPANRRGHLALLLILAEQDGERQAAGVGIGDIGSPGGQDQGDQADQGKTCGGQEHADIIGACADRKDGADHQNNQARREDADDRRLHNILPVFCETAIVTGNCGGATTKEPTVMLTPPTKVMGAEGT